MILLEGLILFPFEVWDSINVDVDEEKQKIFRMYDKISVNMMFHLKQFG